MLESISEFCKTLPEKPGIYKMLDESRQILYVGKAKNLRKRVIYYSKSDLPLRLARMVFLIRSIEYVITKSEAEAFLLEAKEIKFHKPRFNVLLKDDKSFPYIKINFDHQFPSIMKYRGKITDKNSLFGPFASNSDLEKSLGLIKKIFKIRGCSDSYFINRKRACLQYQIKRCSAPCVGKIEQEEYRDLVNLTIDFLKGRSANLQKGLAEKMQNYSESLEFEKAAEIRDSIKALTYIQKNSELLEVEEDIDVIAIISKNGTYCIQIFMYKSGTNYGSSTYFPSHAEGASEQEVFSSFIGQYYQTKIPSNFILSNVDLPDQYLIEQALYELHKVKTSIVSHKLAKYKYLLEHVLRNAEESLENYLISQSKNMEALLKIKEIFNLEDIPNRIEVYDNSHIMGKFAIGVMIVASFDGFEKNEYRKYTVDNKNKYGGDDYQMLREVMIRRIKKIQDNTSKIPSLIIIDGGKAHMHVVKKIFDENNIKIPFVSMSKGEKRDAGGETFHTMNGEFTLSNRDEAMKYLQVLRDEAHRFAITSHRQKRTKSLEKSGLDDIPQIGERRKKQLLNYFGSFQSIKEAGIDDIMKVEGISKNLAEKIFAFLH